MTDKELKKLKDDLWHSADMLRAGAHLAANKYGQPILGLIFLRYADILYKQHKSEINKRYNELKGGRIEKSIEDISKEVCGFYLPEEAYFDFINNAPDDAEKATLVKKAMQEIEKHNKEMQGVLPKEVYGQLVPEEEPDLLSKIIRVFKDIPENISIDLFGEIYEYFLGNFALAEGKDGGTFYTPATVVRYMVEVLKPESGDKMFLDPACGSGGMFVQAARYMHNHNANENDMMKFRCYGVEKEPDTVKLAKMNLLLNNIRGEITEANSFYSDPYNAVGKFDYVMANPPFNVDEVVYEKVKDDTRFNIYGIPKNKSKSTKKGSDKKETVPNANYLWISYFASSLKENTGKAALVMANSASDAGNSEYEIRKKMIEEGIIKQMVTLPSNMFSSVTLPATLWFFDKSKVNTDKKDEILFIDARNIFTQVDRAHRKFSDEQIKNLGIITKLYDGDNKSYQELLEEYRLNAIQNMVELKEIVNKLQKYSFYFDGDGKESYDEPKLRSCAPGIIEIDENKFKDLFLELVNEFKSLINKQHNELDMAKLGLHFEQYYSTNQDKKIREYDDLVDDGKKYAEQAVYYIDNILWLIERFPEGKYQDVIGLCKVAKLNGEDGIKDQEYSLNVGRYVGVSFDSFKVTHEEFIDNHHELMRKFDELTVETNRIHEILLEKTRFLMEEENEIEGWHIGKVEELGKFVRGKNITAREMKDGEVPVISAGIDPSGYHSEYNVEGPAITVSSSGANAGYVSFHLENIWAADCSYNNKSNYIYYLYEILHFIQPIITNLQRGSAQPHVYAKDINKIKIIIPPKDVLENINELFKVYHIQKDLISKQVINTEEQIGLVITKLLSDKLEVK